MVSPTDFDDDGTCRHILYICSNIIYALTNVVISFAMADWDDLPADIKAAFKTLGYTRQIWKKDKEPEVSDYDYDELTQEQKDAAATIGYTKKTWDK